MLPTLLPVAIVAMAPTFSPAQSALAFASVHAMEAKMHEAEPPAVRPVRPYRKKRSAVRGPCAGRTVFGYLPHWEYDAPDIPWSALSHLALFGVHVEADGSITDEDRWTGTSAQLLRQEAHDHGVMVVLSAMNLQGASVEALCGDAAARQRAVDALLALVAGEGGDGINIDFEGVPLAARETFVAFMTELAAAFHETLPGSHVSWAGPPIDWNGAFDYAALLSVTDAVFIMGYGYHWSGGDPGPVAPLMGGGPWSKYSLSWSVADYIDYAGEAARPRILLGLPLYGRDWPSADGSVPGQATGKGKAVTLAKNAKWTAPAPWLWDETSHTPYVIYQKGGAWRQRWVDSPASLADKMDLALSEDLAGIGFWAVGYAQGVPEVWDAVASRFGCAQPRPEPVPPDAGSGADTGPLDAGVCEGGCDAGGAGGDGIGVGDGASQRSTSSGRRGDGAASSRNPGEPMVRPGGDGGGGAGPVVASDAEGSRGGGCAASGERRPVGGFPLVGVVLAGVALGAVRRRVAFRRDSSCSAGRRS